MVKLEGIMPARTRRRDTEDCKRKAVRGGAGVRPPRGSGGSGPRDSGERVVSLARPAPAGRDPRHDTGDATRRGRGTHAREAGIGAGDPGTGLVNTGGGVLREGVPLRDRAIQEHDRRFPIRLMCRALAAKIRGIH